MANVPHLLLTPGDPKGIGPEITVKALQRLGELPPLLLTVIGSLGALSKSAKALGRELPQSDFVRYMDIPSPTPGAVAYQSIDHAIKMLAAREAQSLVTGPISKKNLAAAGYSYAGHTEILEHLAQHYFKDPNARAEMIFVYNNFRLLLLTRHVALRDVAATLAVSGAVARPIKTLISFLRNQIGIHAPKLALLGINPHAGELEGSDEEKKYLLPVVNAVNAIGASKIEGPFPADGFFRGFNPETTPYDAIIAPYHDQGLIPFKMLAGYEAVNVTIGLPFLRTSVSHGTAEDIAGKGIANEDSLMAALRLAAMTPQLG